MFDYTLSLFVLHLYLLTRFSNLTIPQSVAGVVLHLYLLTRFSNTDLRRAYENESFTPLLTYKVLKPFGCILQKISVLHLYLLTRFSNDLNDITRDYLVLHLYLLTRFSNFDANEDIMYIVLHLYLLTRFSNCLLCCSFSCLFYTFTYLQGSQTHLCERVEVRLFYTFTYLQGSQTSNSISRSSPNPYILAYV